MQTHCNIFQSCHLVFASNKMCDWTILVEEYTWSCCSIENPCDEKEGDCDSNSECKGKLQCGLDNCNAMNNATHFGDVADCCFDPTSKKNYILLSSLFSHLRRHDQTFMRNLLTCSFFFLTFASHFCQSLKIFT